MVVFLLRHADRSSGSTDSLSPTGVVRANLLARMLAESGVGFAFCSDAQRTRETLEPLRQARGAAFSIRQVSTAGGLNAHIQKIVSTIESLPPDTVAVVVGHSNTVGPIIEGLGGGSIAPIEEHEFDKLFVLFRPASGGAILLQLRYGAESTLPPG